MTSTVLRWADQAPSLNLPDTPQGSSGGQSWSPTSATRSRASTTRFEAAGTIPTMPPPDLSNLSSLSTTCQSSTEPQLEPEATHKPLRKRAGRNRMPVKQNVDSSTNCSLGCQSHQTSYREQENPQSSPCGRSLPHTIRSGLQAALSAVTLDKEECLLPDPDSEAEVEEYCARLRASKNSKASTNED